MWINEIEKKTMTKIHTPMNEHLIFDQVIIER